MFRHFIALLFVTIVAFSCSSDSEPAPEPEPENYHLALGYGKDLGAFAANVTMDGLDIICAMDLSGIIYFTGSTKSGQQQWSKAIDVDLDAQVSPLQFVARADRGSLIATAYSDALTIDVDATGNVLNAKLYEVNNEQFRITNMDVVGDGSKVLSGYHDGFGVDMFGLVFEQDPQGNIVWAKKFDWGAGGNPDVSFIEEANVFAFSNGVWFMTLDRAGNVLKQSALPSTNLSMKKIRSIGSHVFILFSHLQSGDLTLFKVGAEGSVVSAISSSNGMVDNPTLAVYESQLYLSMIIEDHLKLAAFDTDLSLVNQASVANLTDIPYITTSVAGTSAGLQCMIRPFSKDPAFGLQGFHILRVSQADWQPRCETADPIQLAVGAVPVPTAPVVSTFPLEDVLIQARDVNFTVSNTVPARVKVCN